MYGHVRKMAEEVKRGVEKVPDVVASIYQVAETVPKEILDKARAPPKAAHHPIITGEELRKADGILFGIPTRFGCPASQMKAFLDTLGWLWATRKMAGRPAGVFVSTNSVGGGQETTVYTFLPHFTHFGLIYVPLGISDLPRDSLTVAEGGTTFGAGTLAGQDGTRQPSRYELSLANYQGEKFATITKALKIGRIQIANQEKP